MKYIVAVSGGVDSVVLLDMLVNDNLPSSRSPVSISQLIVAHFDHGIRSDSATDAAFVRDLAEKYNLPYETAREELGADASEELARDRRYAFLRSVAKKHNAKIITAHHLDDLVETIAINITRGTGWRGLAVLDSLDIERPLLGTTKPELIDYAQKKSLEWRDDPTNQNLKYLRNDVRQRLTGIDERAREALRLYQYRQVFLKKSIDQEAQQLVGSPPYSRYFFTQIPEREAVELLRVVCISAVGMSPTIPQRKRALLAIKTQTTGSRYEVAKGITLVFTRTTFIVEEASEVVL